MKYISFVLVYVNHLFDLVLFLLKSNLSFFHSFLFSCLSSYLNVIIKKILETALLKDVRKIIFCLVSVKIVFLLQILLNACCPGWVRTDLAGPRAPKSPEEGAVTPVYLALLPPGTTEPHGKFVSDKKVQPW